MKICNIPQAGISKDKFVLVHLDSNCDIEKMIQLGAQNGVEGIVFVQELGKDG